ncbi:MAG: hypothetical protein ACKESC_00765 [Candidatus Hodgkinia cicadicola]
MSPWNANIFQVYTYPFGKWNIINTFAAVWNLLLRRQSYNNL